VGRLRRYGWMTGFVDVPSAIAGASLSRTGEGPPARGGGRARAPSGSEARRPSCPSTSRADLRPSGSGARVPSFSRPGEGTGRGGTPPPPRSAVPLPRSRSSRGRSFGVTPSRRERESGLNLMDDCELRGPACSRTAEGCRSAARRSRVLDQAGPRSRLGLQEVKARDVRRFRRCPPGPARPQSGSSAFREDGLLDRRAGSRVRFQPVADVWQVCASLCHDRFA